MSDDDQVAENATKEALHAQYWRANLKLLGALMSIWFICSFGAGILFRPFLDQFMLGGYPLGFWFAQQGATYIFLALIIVYVLLMRRIEHKYGVDAEGS